MTSICFRIGLDLDDLIQVLSFEFFLSTFAKTADCQVIKDSSNIFLSDNNFHLIRLSKPSRMLSLLFFSNISSLCFPIITSFSHNLTKPEAVNYYHTALHLGCCSSPRSASDYPCISSYNVLMMVI